MVSPSGAKRALRTSPRRKVRRWNDASVTCSFIIRLAKYQPANAAPAMETM